VNPGSVCGPHRLPVLDLDGLEPRVGLEEEDRQREDTEQNDDLVRNDAQGPDPLDEGALEE